MPLSGGGDRGRIADVNKASPLYTLFQRFAFRAALRSIVVVFVDLSVVSGGQGLAGVATQISSLIGESERV
jgi:hypothetical protein